jgi:hypothetical protein
VLSPEEKRSRKNAANRRWVAENRDRNRSVQRAWAAAHPKAKSSDLVRDANLRKNYDITPETYDRVHAAQRGLCAICSQPSTDRRGYPLSVGHNHQTKQVRKLLCGNCNLMLGHSQDDPARLRAAAEYLEQNS